MSKLTEHDAREVELFTEFLRRVDVAKKAGDQKKTYGQIYDSVYNGAGDGGMTREQPEK